MNSIMDNQEVTLEMLNNIAIDLGATSFNEFTTNKFGANELNQITQALVTKGILLSSEQCKPIISDSKLYIRPGTIVFDNGAKIVLKEALELDLENGSYIYALNDLSLNTCKIIVSSSAPASGDYVELASVDNNGDLSDRRQFSTGKNLPYGGNAETELTETLTFSSSTQHDYTFNVGWSSYKYILYKGMYGYLTCSPISDNETISITYYSSCKMSITKSGQDIHIQTNGAGGRGSTSVVITLKFI